MQSNSVSKFSTDWGIFMKIFLGGAPTLRNLKNTTHMAWKLIPCSFSEESEKDCMMILTYFDRSAITYSDSQFVSKNLFSN